MVKAKNVLFLLSSSELYGSGRIILQVLRLYKREGFNPIVVVTGPGQLVPIMEEEGFKVYIQNLGILRRKYVTPSGLLNRLGKNLGAYRYLNELHAKYNFAQVYSNTLAVIVGAYWAKRNKIPHTWHIHEILLSPRPLVKLLASSLDITTPRPIAVSQAVAEHWQPLLKKAQVQVIHNGIPYDEFLADFPTAKKELGLPEDQVIIGMIGRINPWKGQMFFLEMAEKLAAKHPNTHFVFVGDPFPGYEPILEELLQSIKNKQMENRVSYLGFREDIPRVMNALDIFVLPSILPDPFPTVILEAMASARPVVATYPGGSAEMVVDGKTGFLIPAGNVDLGAQVLEKLVISPEMRAAFGKAGRTRVLNEYSLKAFEDKIKSIYGES